jgi:hypothetical protein
MKAVFPWQIRIHPYTYYYNNGQFIITEEWYRDLCSKDYTNNARAACILYLTNPINPFNGIFKNTNYAKSFYICKTYTCVFPTYTQTEFDTLEAAKSHIDEELESMNIKLLPEHMLVLK